MFSYKTLLSNHHLKPKWFLPTCLFLTISTFSFSQFTKEVTIQMAKEKIGQADYIFEGKIVNGESYYDNNNNILSAVKIEINHVYRGKNLKKGTIELLQRGGEINGESEYPAHVGDFLYFKDEKTAIFICKKSDLLEPTKYKRLDNKEKVALLRNPLFTDFGLSQKHEISSYDLLNFETREDFYNYISSFDNITLPAKKNAKKRYWLRKKSK